MELRPARLEDAEATRVIYNLEVTTGTSVFDITPRSPQEHREWLTARSGVHAIVVAEEAGEILGFGSLSRYKERSCYSTSVENSVYVAQAHRGKGVGRALLTDLVRVAKEHGFHTVIARIEATNEVSVALHRSIGFNVVGIEREIGRKFGRWLDLCEMQLMLQDVVRKD